MQPEIHATDRRPGAGERPAAAAAPQGHPARHRRSSASACSPPRPSWPASRPRSSGAAAARAAAAAASRALRGRAERPAPAANGTRTAGERPGRAGRRRLLRPRAAAASRPARSSSSRARRSTSRRPTATPSRSASRPRRRSRSRSRRSSPGIKPGDNVTAIGTTAATASIKAALGDASATPASRLRRLRPPAAPQGAQGGNGGRRRPATSAARVAAGSSAARASSDRARSRHARRPRAFAAAGRCLDARAAGAQATAGRLGRPELAVPARSRRLALAPGQWHAAEPGTPRLAESARPQGVARRTIQPVSAAGCDLSGGACPRGPDDAVVARRARTSGMARVRVCRRSRLSRPGRLARARRRGAGPAHTAGPDARVRCTSRGARLRAADRRLRPTAAAAAPTACGSTCTTAASDQAAEPGQREQAATGDEHAGAGHEREADVALLVLRA